jgi:hypothetical protein
MNPSMNLFYDAYMIKTLCGIQGSMKLHFWYKNKKNKMGSGYFELI